MELELSDNRYGKSRVRLVKVERGPGGRHRLRDLEVEVRFEGEYEAAYRDGDNRAVVPTDTMKNTVYAVARERSFGSAEALGLALAEHFLAGEHPPQRVEVGLGERLWSRIAVAGRPQGHAFTAGDGPRRTARVRADGGGGREVDAGLAGLRLLKTAGSGFSGFPRDRFTTLAETDDRVLATTVEARWRYGAGVDPAAADFDRLWEGVRERLTATFAEHPSRSAQHTLWAMGEAVLAAAPEIEEIRLVLPNQHHLPVDLAPLGLDNPQEIYVATDAPFGVIEGTVRRR